MAGRTAIVSAANKALIVPHTPGMARLFPEGKQLRDMLVVPHDMHHFTLLKQLKFKVPNPVLTYYDWALSPDKPFEVQRITVDHMTSHRRSYNLNGMGTGKTRTALWAWEALHKEGACHKMLVVCKLSTMNKVWVSEALKVMPYRKCVVLHGSKKKRRELLADKSADIYVINHDGVKVILKELYARPDIDVLCIDELASAYRNASERTKMMAKYAATKTWVWGMTGSPQPHGPMDVFQQCKVVTPNTVPYFMSHARDELMIRSLHNQHVWLPKSGATAKAFSWMQPAVRFNLSDVVELPEAVNQDIEVPMEPLAQKIYHHVINHYVAKMDNGEVINAPNAAAAMSKMLQIAGGYVYSSSSGRVLEVPSETRKRAMMDVIEESEGKVLVFAAFRHIVEGISKCFNHDPASNDYCLSAIVHGGVLLKKRDDIFNAFQDPNNPLRVIVAHPGCMAHGLTLTEATTVIWYGPVTSLETYEQANARIRRVGQTRKQLYVHIYGSPVERKVFKMLQKRATAQDVLLGMFEKATAEGGAS